MVRLAAAVETRARPGAPLRFGSVERTALLRAFSDSPLGLAFNEPRPRSSSRPRPHLDLVASGYSSRHFAASVDVGGRDPGRIAIKVEAKGHWVEVVIDAEARRPPPGEEAPAGLDADAAVERSELTYLAICALETATAILLPELVEVIGGAPLAFDDVWLWAASPANGNLSQALSTSYAARPVPGGSETWQARLAPDPVALSDAVEALRSELETYYIDAGFEDEGDLARRDLEAGLRRRRYQD